MMRITGNAPITTPANFTNTANPQTIFARVENNDEPTCFATTSFDLIVYEQPEFVNDPRKIYQNVEILV